MMILNINILKQVLSSNGEHLERFRRQSMAITRSNLALRLREVGSKPECDGVCDEFGANELQRALNDPFRSPSVGSPPRSLARFRNTFTILVILCKNICDNNFPGQFHNNVESFFCEI